ncbi:MAG: hypothetical protein ACK54T_10480 [bacterium]
MKARPRARPTHRLRQPGFALPLVLMLLLAASVLVTVLLTRRSSARVAVKKQSDGYVSHHIQAGLKDFISVFLSTAKRTKESNIAGGVVGFNLDLEQNLRMEVRLKDLGGSILATAEPGSIRGQVLGRAVVILQESKELDLRYIRVFGPPRVSVHGSEPEALAALAQAVDPACDAREFVNQIVQERNKRDLNDNDIRNAGSKARIGGTKLDLLTAVTTADPNFWWLEARVIDPNGRELIRQGGFATGSLKPGTGTSSGSWSIELWADLPKGEPFAAALTTR